MTWDEEVARKQAHQEYYNLGQRCKLFWVSDVGQYLQQRCDTYERQVMDEFAQADVKDEANMLRLQAFLQVPKLLRDWISRAIDEGEMAEFQLREDED